MGIRSFVLSNFSLYIGKVSAFKTPSRGGATEGGWGCDIPHGLKIVHLLCRFEIFTWQMKCRRFISNMPKAWYTSHILCFVGLHRSHSCKRRMLYLLRLEERCEFSLLVSCINLEQANFGNALMCYFSFSKYTQTSLQILRQFHLQIDKRKAWCNLRQEL